jgi:hypothetical protein
MSQLVLLFCHLTSHATHVMLGVTADYARIRQGNSSTSDLPVDVS